MMCLILSKIKPNILEYGKYVALRIHTGWFGVKIVWGEMSNDGVLFQ